MGVIERAIVSRCYGVAMGRSVENEREPAVQHPSEHLAHRPGLKPLDERRQEALDHELFGDLFPQAPGAQVEELLRVDLGDGRRTHVHVEGIDDPLIASRSELAIAADLAQALGQVPPGPSRADRMRGQDRLF
jgi:hypothetical protein